MADGSCFIIKSELFPVFAPLRLFPPLYDASNFNESANELDSNDKISSKRSSAWKEKKENRQENR